jgi:glycine/sarcosine N-methyltransferase
MFHDLTDVYDAMVDWPKRLGNEGPFYRRWFERCGVQRVLDTACGAGRHAAMFQQWGLKVEAADLSRNMIERARKNFGDPPGLRWSVRGFDEPIEPYEPFDAVVCVGNSLPLAPDMETIRRAVGRMAGVLRGGGLLVIHALNVGALPDGPCVWQKKRTASIPPRGEVLIVKGVHRHGTRAYVDLVAAELSNERTVHTECVPFWGIEAEQLAAMAAEAGMEEIRFFGGYQEQPYDRAKSIDLLMTARKR